MDWNDFFDNFGEYAVRGFGYYAIIILLALLVIFVILGSNIGVFLTAVPLIVIAIAKARKHNEDNN